MDDQDGRSTMLEHLQSLVREHCGARGYAIESEETASARRVLTITIPDRPDAVRLSFDGEMFLLTFAGGYSWSEFAYEDEDRAEALLMQLRFLDAYAEPRTVEVVVRRRFRRDRRELRVSNGAVLRSRGWSSGPPSLA